MTQDPIVSPRSSDERAGGVFQDLATDLRRLIHAHVRDAMPDDEFSLALRRLARAARAGGVEPQQLVIAVKTAWYALPDVERRAEPAEQGTRDPLEQIVTHCIDGFYA